jgi:hypothetical protein
MLPDPTRRTHQRDVQERLGQFLFGSKWNSHCHVRLGLLRRNRSRGLSQFSQREGAVTSELSRCTAKKEPFPSAAW